MNIRDLIITDEYFNLLICIINLIDPIKSNGRFTAVGWYKSGLIIYRGLVEGRNKNINGFNNKRSNDEVKVGHGEIKYHVI